MLSSLLRFELKYHFRQITFKIAAIIFFLLGMIATRGGFGNEVYKNSPYAITNITGLLSLCSIFAATLFCASVVLRDSHYKMDAIIYSTSVKRFPYFMTKLSGLFIAVFLILCFTTAGVFIGSFMLPEDELGKTVIYYFIQPLLTFGVPNVFLSCALIFCVGLLTDNARAVYAAGVLLFVLYWVGSVLGNSPLLATSSLNPDGPGTLSLLADPFGLSAFFSETRSWTVAQKNAHLFALDGTFLLNRLLWAGFALVLLILSYRFFRFEVKLPAAGKNKRPLKAVAVIPYRSIAVDPQGLAYYWKAFCSQLKLETISVFRHIPFMVMMTLWIFMYAMETKDTLFGGPYSIRSYPSTSLLLQELRSIKPAMLLIIFYAAELIWRERTVNMQALVYGTPVKNVVPWAAKTAALGILIAAIITANIGIGIGLQLSNGYTRLEFLRYASLYYYSGFPLLLFAVLVVFIMSLTSNKYLGMLICLFITAFLLFSPRLGIDHYLLRYASVPELLYSAMNGFGHYARAFNWYMLYWSGLALILSLATIALWQNSRQLNLRLRLSATGSQWGKPGKLFLLAGILIWTGAGSWVYYQTNIIGRYKNKLAQQEWQLEYEKKYKQLADIYQPVIKAVKTTVDLYPDQQMYTVKGTYRLRNESSAPITALWLGTDPEVSSASFTVPSSKEGVQDKHFNEQRYDLTTPLLPGKEMEIRFSLQAIRSGFMPFNNEHSVVENGSYIELEKYLPFLGYNDRYESDDKTARRKKGLPETPALSSVDTIYHLVDYETIISTKADQQIITIGELQKQWKDGDRHYFHYKTTQPSNFMFAFSSAKYASIKEEYKGIALNIYYQPGQTYNLPAIMQGMKDALDYNTEHFGPYPYKQLALAEIPQYRGAATSYPGAMFSVENINFMSNYSDTTKVNQAYAITAHETAHQWWGARFQPAAAAGNKLLTESLAKYIEDIVLERRFGKMYLRNYLQTDNRLYSILRSMYEDEMPLDSATGQPFVHYQKGSLAMYALKENLGEEKLTHALQSLWTKHAAPGPKAKPEHLKQELYKDASPAQAILINELLSKMIIWSMKLSLIECKQLPDGRFSLTVQVNIVKNNGRYHSFKPLPIDDDITIAVFEQQPEDWGRYTQPLHLQTYHFTNGETRLTMIVNKKPASVIIDPYGYMPEETQQDNIITIKSKK
ncbi:MAG: hypothetical protein BGO52_15770 [Sphingobacteriales bacterium 44-61]|nr:MAG: hypothetical protein BGO52_15770 [Sphingobacteriales bacterium 44-61]